MASFIDLVPRRFLAAQLRRPSGLVGKLIVAPMLNRRNGRLNMAVLSALDIEATDRVLEIGFGGGDLIDRVLPLLSAGHLTGADFSSDMVELCSRRFATALGSGRLELLCASVETLPLPDASIDKVCTANTIYFWSDLRTAARELHRVIVPGGRLVIGFAPRETLEQLPVTQHGFAMYDADEVSSLLVDSGFADVHVDEIDGPAGMDCCATAFKPS